VNVFAKIGIIAAASFILSQGIYTAIEKGRTHYFYDKIPKYDKLLRSGPDYDLLMLGSSRTHYHNDPKIIDSLTNLVSFNAGINGANMASLYVMLSGYLEAHKPPKLLLLEVSMLSFKVDKSNPMDATLYFRYLDNKGVYRSLNESWKYPGLLKALPFLRLSQLDDVNKSYGFKGLGGSREQTTGLSYKGYTENITTVVADSVSHPELNCFWVSYTERGRFYTDKILELCRQKNIRAVVVYAPEYKRLNFVCPDGNRIIDTISAICGRYRYPFWNYLNNPICQQQQLFANIGHLNLRGARVYSEMLGQDIHNYLGNDSLPGSGVAGLRR
jgi:hypothetical protein